MFPPHTLLPHFLHLLNLLTSCSLSVSVSLSLTLLFYPKNKKQKEKGKLKQKPMKEPMKVISI